MTVSSRENESSEQRTLRVAKEQLGKAIHRLEPEQAGDVDEVIHEVRKRIKKVRALLKLAWGSVGSKSIAKVDHRLRDAARPLSAARDASALILSLDKLADRSVGLVPVEIFDEPRALLLEHKEAVIHDEIVVGLALEKAAKALRRARKSMDRWNIDESRSGAIRGLKRAYKQGREAFEFASEDPSPESLHELRKRVKTFLYQLRSLKSPKGTPAARIENLCSILANDLGEGHDLDVLRAYLDRLVANVPLLVVLDRRRVDLRRGSLQRAGVVFRDKPRRFVRILESSTSSMEAVRSDG